MDNQAYTVTLLLLAFIIVAMVISLTIIHNADGEVPRGVLALLSGCVGSFITLIIPIRVDK